MTTSARLPVRRSALEAAHARLGARWRSEHERWPVSYGDDEGEARALQEGIALAEPGPYDKLIVRGASTADALRRLGFAALPGVLEPAHSLDDVSAWSIAGDEAVLVRMAGAARTSTVAASVGPEGSLSEIAGTLRSAGLAVVDVGSAYTVLRLVGPRLPGLLQELCSVDLSARAVPDLHIAQVPFGGTRVVLARRDDDDLPGFVLLVVRDEAEYLWDLIVHLGAAHGLRPVGASAVRPTAPTAAWPDRTAAATKARAR